jgi:transcriptional regulator with XRE-family HTH domain
MKDKIRQLRKSMGYNRTEFEAETGIPAKTWSNIENGLQKANEDHLQAIIKRWPEFAYWLMTGKTIPSEGQISPELEDTRQKLKKAG